MLASPSCLTSHDPLDCNLPGSSVPRILQARTGNHFLLQGGLHDPGIKPGSPTLQADFLPSEPPGKPRLVRKREGGTLTSTTKPLRGWEGKVTGHLFCLICRGQGGRVQTWRPEGGTMSPPGCVERSPPPTSQTLINRKMCRQGPFFKKN